MLNTGVELSFQAVDINGDPMLGQRVGETTSGSSGAATFNVAPGQYIVLIRLPGVHFRPDLSWPGLANLTVIAGQTTQVSVAMGMVVSSISAPYDSSCLNVINPNGSTYQPVCKPFVNGLSMLEALPGTYELVFVGIASITYAGPVTVSAGQTIERHCSSNQGKIICNQ